MQYQEAVSYVHSLLRFGVKPGLERMRAMMEALGNPQDRLRFAHVAGTNGKGSTCAMLAEILCASGYKTGLFTSPYVIEFRERMQVNGEMIPQDTFAALIERIRPVADRLAAQGMQPTEFEVITAAAFLYFEQEKCDIVVLEVGLGGRLDSTNIIKTPLVSVITSVSMDHMNVLGNTLEEIAAENGLAVRTLTALFAETLQMTPVQYMNAYRVSVACERFQITDMSIAEVAKWSGFDDVKYFSRVFRKEKGMSPQEYKKTKPNEDAFAWVKKKEAEVMGEK